MLSRYNEPDVTDKCRMGTSNQPLLHLERLNSACKYIFRLKINTIMIVVKKILDRKEETGLDYKMVKKCVT